MATTPVDRIRATLGLAPKPVLPPDVKDAIDRGRREMRKDAVNRDLCACFERGDQYRYRDASGYLANQATSLDPAGGKPRHRIRNTYNFIRPLVEDKISAATSRIPSYEVVASTSDPDDRSSAGTAQKVALYGYDKWGLRKVRQCVIKSSIAQGGDGFAMPYFEPNVGPYRAVDDGDGGLRWVGEGEIRVLQLGGNEVFWEAGVAFEHSRFYCVERARPIADVKQMPGYCGGELTPDASTSETATSAKQISDSQMVLVTDYMERPCPKYPEGRRFIIANAKVVVDWRLADPMAAQAVEPYPHRGHDGKILDEPCLHRLSYTIDGQTDRDLGMVWQLIDAQRTISDCVNKLLEWKNRALNPQMTAAINSLLDGIVPNDEPGFVYWTKPGQLPPTFLNTPTIPRELFEIVSLMREAMQFFASYADAQATSNVAAATVNAVQAQAQRRWEAFLGDLAEFDSRLMRHCLHLVQRHYTEPRLLKIKGWFGPEVIKDFMGSDLNGQQDVTVLPGSLTQLSRGEALNKVQFIAQNFPGFLSPEMALAYMDGGAASSLVQSYELDVARIDHVIMSIRDGSIMQWQAREEVDPTTGQPLMVPVAPDPITGEPPIDPVTGQPQTEVAQVPGWMPMRDVDNLAVWKRRLGDWMKTEDFERMDPAQRAPAVMILTQVGKLEAEAAMKQQMMMQEQAAGMGLSNAQRPAGPKALPSTPDGATPQ